jgi:hypothetical protein
VLIFYWRKDDEIPVFSLYKPVSAMTVVGSSVVFGKVITAVFPVFLASGLRFGITFAVMMPVLIK